MKTTGARALFPVILAMGAMALVPDAMAIPEPDDIAGPLPFTINGCSASATWNPKYLSRVFGVSERAVRRASRYGMDALALCTAPWSSVEHTLKQAGARKPGFDQPDKAQEFRALSLKSDDGTIAPDGIQKSYQQRLKVLADTKAKLGGITPGQPFWTELGPGNVGGRVRAILPFSPTRILVGSVSGGLWLTENAGTSWTVIRDAMPNVAISCLVPDPSDATIVYVCTGEGFFNGDAIRGDGIYRITGANGLPATWTITRVAGTNPVGQAQWRYVNRLVVLPNPGDPSNVNNRIITAATNDGIYRSTNGGTSFVQVNPDRHRDIKYHPLSTSNLVAGGNEGPSYSLDGGATWNPVATTGLPIANADRVEVYPVAGQAQTWLASVNIDEGQLWRSTNQGVTWTRRDTAGLSLSTTPAGGVLGSQGWYDNALWASPDGSRVMVGGVGLRLSLDGGVTFGVQTCVAPDCPLYGAGLTNIHTDHHAIVPATDYGVSGIVYFGGDGGLNKASIGTQATNLGASIFTSLNNGLGILQFYGGAGSGSGSTLRVSGGTQDNGTWTWNGTTWSFFNGGDGGESAVDPTNTQFVYGEYQNGVIYRSSIGGTYGPPYPVTICQGILDVSCSNGVVNPKVNFVAPFILDPNNSDRMFFGAQSLWRTNNVRTSSPGQPTWTSIRGPQTNRYCQQYPADPYCASYPNSYVSTIAVAPGNPDLIWVGYNDGQLFRTVNGTAVSPSWTDFSAYTGLASPVQRMVMRIVIDPSNNQRVWVTFGGYNLGNVVRTINGGTGWTDVHGNLPAAPVRTLTRHPVQPDTLYAGTEVGVFATDTAGTTWSAQNEGPGTVSAEEIFFTANDTLYVATHGRGLFRATLVTTTDLAIAQSAPGPAVVGKDIVYTVTATNVGLGATTNVVVTDTIPAGSTFVWASPGCTQGGGGIVTCNVGALAVGANAVRTVVVRPTSVGTKTNLVSVSATEADSNSANNTNSLDLTASTVAAGTPVLRYRLFSPVTKEHHFTTDLNEYNVLGTYVGTWVQEGTVGKVLNNPGSFGGVTAVPYYRLYDNNTRWHHWTTDANEYYTLGLVYAGWNMEGVDGYILPTTAVGATQLYRLNYPALGALHHWTIDANEYNTLITPAYGWVGEGGSGFVIQ